jgi:cell division protein FtsI/penicillin-binding protein 2
MGIVWLRATQLQMIDGDVWAEAAQDMRERTEILPALRGPIVSADGVVLAEDAPVFQLAVSPWDWQRRARVRCTSCGAIYHQSGRRLSTGELRLRFPRSCACARKARRTVGVDAYPRTHDPEEKPRLEVLPKGDLRALEAALDVAPGTIARLAKERVDEVSAIVVRMRAAMAADDEDLGFEEKRLELAEQDLLRRPYVLVGRMPEEAARLVLTDEVGQYRGLRVQSALRRHYPLGDFASQLIGFTSQLGKNEYETLKAEFGDRVGYSTRIGRKGLERALNWEMHGTPGYRKLELDSDGQWGRVIEEVPPRPGKPAFLTIDAKLSRIAEELLFHGRRGAPGGYVPQGRPSGAFVALDAYTGEVLIWSEAPRFDLNDELDELYDPSLVEAEANQALGTWVPLHPDKLRMTLEEWQRRMVQPAPLGMSRAGQIAVEPGSTMKLFMALGMLESGLPLPYREYSCRPGQHGPGCHGSHDVDLVQAIVRSCNRYFAFSVRDSKQWSTYRRFLGGFMSDLGFGQSPSREISEWSAGQWLWPWVDFTMPTLLAEVRSELARALKGTELDGKAPELTLAALPGTPATLGGDLERVAKRLAEVAAWTARRTGAKKLQLSVEKLEVIERMVNVRFGVRCADKNTWFELPGTDHARLPKTLAALPRERRGIRGHLERGGTVWFTAQLVRRVGRADDRAPRVIRPSDGRNVAIGQGPILVTPLQMARAVSVFANGGLLVEPHVTRAVGNREQATHTRRLKVDPRNLELVREGMYGVVNLPEGTADTADWHLVPATVYGKTGTAQVGHSWKPFGETEDGGPWHHWFVGFAEAPGMRTIAFACVLHARAEGGAGVTAAHAVADILARWYDSDTAKERR